MRRQVLIGLGALTVAFGGAACGGSDATSSASDAAAAATDSASAAVSSATEAASSAAAGAAGDATAGKAVFTANCAGCHTLADAGAAGTVGPNLDEAKPALEKIIERVTNGAAPMPAFGKDGKLDATQIADVAAYVSSATAG